MTTFQSTNYPRSAFYSIAGYLLIAIGLVAWKTVLSDYSLAQILFLEAIVCIPLFVLLSLYKGGIHLLKTHYPLLQLVRGILQTLSAYIGLYGLIHLPVATYTMLGYCSPFLMTLAAHFILKEKCPVKGWISIVVGFIGIALVTQPEYTQNLTAILCVLLSCVFWAANVIVMRYMPKDDTICFPFYTLTTAGLISTVILIFNGFTPMPTNDFVPTITAGIFFFFGAQLLFSAYRLAPLFFNTPFQYTQMIWIGLLSYMMWREIPTSIQLIGLFLIITATLYSSYLKDENKAAE